MLVTAGRLYVTAKTVWPLFVLAFTFACPGYSCVFHRDIISCHMVSSNVTYHVTTTALHVVPVGSVSAAFVSFMLTLFTS